MTRRGFAIGVLILWAIALGILAHKQFGKSDDEQLAESARRIDPTPYYYLVYQGDTPIGSISSEVDTAIGPTKELRVTDRFHGKMALSGKPRFIQASLITYLSRKFVADSFVVEMTGDGEALRRTFPKSPSGLPPELVPMTFMLSGSPEIGRSRSYKMYDPMGDSTDHVTLRVAAESLFTVSDSAMYDSTTKHWVSAHADTVRSWSVTAITSGLTIWVDAEGRIVNARGPKGLYLIRTAYEIAFANWNFRNP